MVYVLLTCSGHRSLPVVCYMYAHGIYALCSHSTNSHILRTWSNFRLLYIFYIRALCAYDMHNIYAAELQIGTHVCVPHAFSISVRDYSSILCRFVVTEHRAFGIGAHSLFG